MQCMEVGKIIMPTHLVPNGLCDAAIHGIISRDIFELLRPSDEDLDELRGDNMNFAYWASETTFDDLKIDYAAQFNPLRQNIILFMAAINGEL